jgi:hypothetical protein
MVLGSIDSESVMRWNIMLVEYVAQGTHLIVDPIYRKQREVILEEEGKF